MSRFKKIIVVALVLGLITAVAGFWGLVPGFAYTSTKYAPDFSEAAFDRIKAGDSAEIVLKTVGPPMTLERPIHPVRIGRIDEWFEYTGPGWALFYKRRVVVLSNSIVVSTARFVDHK